MRGVVCGLTFAALTAPIGAGAATPPAIVFHDEFDDGDPLTNTRGIGGGWKPQRVAKHAVHEGAGALEIALGSEHASFALKQEGTLDFWHRDGLVFEFEIKDTTVRSAHTWDFCNAYAWQFALISADFARAGFPWHGAWFKEGAMWFTLGRRDDSDTAEFRVNVCNRALANPDGRKHPGAGTPGYAQPVAFRFKVSYPAIVRVRMHAEGWSFELPGQEIGARRTEFNWTTDLGAAPITTEFQRGAWMFVHARVLGLTGRGTLHTPLHSGDNAGRLERVTVIRPEKRD